jgi:hypothetical protein
MTNEQHPIREWLRTWGAIILGTWLAISSVAIFVLGAITYDNGRDTDGVVARLARAESEASVTRVLSADQRCAFSSKSTAAHAATVAEFNEIIEFVDRAGVPRSATLGLRRRAADKADRVKELVADVAECRRTRDRYLAQLTERERRAYEERRVEHGR